MPIVEKDVNKKICAGCGEARPFPTEPGLWEYLEMPALAAHRAETGKPTPWQTVTVRSSLSEPGFLEIVPLGKKRPIWWPEQAMWRKKSDFVDSVDQPVVISLAGIDFEIVRVDGDPAGVAMPNRILLERGGITAEYILTNATDEQCNCVQKGTWEDSR